MKNFLSAILKKINNGNWKEFLYFYGVLLLIYDFLIRYSYRGSDFHQYSSLFELGIPFLVIAMAYHVLFESDHADKTKKSSFDHLVHSADRMQEEIKKIAEYDQFSSVSIRDFVHYTGNDICAGENDHIDSENGRIISLVGGYYIHQREMDIKLLASTNSSNVIYRDFVKNASREFAQYGIEKLLNMPSKYWIDFCVLLASGQNKKDSMLRILDEYEKDIKKSDISWFLPSYQPTSKN